MTLPPYDPSRYLEYNPGTRMTIYRRVALLVPAGILFTIMLAVALMNLPDTILVVIVFAICALALDVEAVNALRDLPAKPVVTRGKIERRWSKGRFLFFGRVHYLLIERRLFEVGPVASAELHLGDEVIIEHWPHTNVVVTLERAPAATPQ